jgi:hypothetical protein
VSTWSSAPNPTFKGSRSTATTGSRAVRSSSRTTATSSSSATTIPSSSAATTHRTITSITLDHPCGLQVCGDYLLLATEPINGSPQSKILTYDLSQLTNDKFPDPHYGIVDLDEKAGAVAVTSMKWPVGPDYVAHLVAVHDNENLRFYVSDGGPLGTCKFHEEFRAKIPSVGTESIALFTETSGDIYLLLLHAKSQATVHDKATLLKVHIAGKFVEDLGKTRHFYTHHGGLKGAMGVHFRYGAGARAVAHDAMELLATQMHLVGRKFALNTFTGPTKPLERLPARVNLPRHDG